MRVNFGVFMLRRAPDETTAVFWEIVIHTGSSRSRLLPITL